MKFKFFVFLLMSACSQITEAPKVVSEERLPTAEELQREDDRRYSEYVFQELVRHLLEDIRRGLQELNQDLVHCTGTTDHLVCK